MLEFIEYTVSPALSPALQDPGREIIDDNFPRLEGVVHRRPKHAHRSALDPPAAVEPSVTFDSTQFVGHDAF